MKVQSGYPHIDKPWKQKYISQEFILSRKTLYRALYDNNKNNLDQIAIQFFGFKASYKQLFQKIDQVAKALTAYGIQKGDVVSTIIAGIPEFIYLFYATNKIGAIIHPIPILDEGDVDTEDIWTQKLNLTESKLFFLMSSFDTATLRKALRNSAVKTVVNISTLQSSPLRILLAVLSFLKKPQIKTNSQGDVSWRSFLKAGSSIKEVQEVAYEKGKTAAILYSSGTSGKPKGILLSNDVINSKVKSYEQLDLNMKPGMTLYAIIPPSYATGTSTSYHFPLYYGCTLFLDPRYSKETFVKNLLQKKIFGTVAPTSLFEGFLDPEITNNYYKKGKHNLTQFKYSFQGGEPADKNVILTMQARMENMGFTGFMMNGYGTSENGPVIATQTPTVRTPGSSGVILPGLNVKITDEQNRPLGYNQIGEIKVHNPHTTMSGYLGNPEITEKYFETDEEGVRWNLVGDAGYISEEGEIFVLGRQDDAVVKNGKRYYNFVIGNYIKELEEVDSVLVVSRANGEGEDEVVVHIVLNPNFKTIVTQQNRLLNLIRKIQDHVFSKNHDPEEVPEVFKFRDQFPLCKSGKKDKKLIESETDGMIRSKFK